MVRMLGLYERFDRVALGFSFNHYCFHLKILRNVTNVVRLDYKLGRSVPCLTSNFEDYLKIDFHDWMICRFI